jgi:hypothetical protein
MLDLLPDIQPLNLKHAITPSSPTTLVVTRGTRNVFREVELEPCDNVSMTEPLEEELFP